MDERGLCRLRYIDKTDGPVTFSHGGSQGCPVSTQQDSEHTLAHTNTYAQRTQVDYLFDRTSSCTESSFTDRNRPATTPNPMNFSTC